MPSLENNDLIGASTSVELSSNRTSLSLDRTRMSADRTLMSIVRTSLSMISFGFTINRVFSKAAGDGVLADADQTGRMLGLSLLALGVLLLIMGLGAHIRFNGQLNARRHRLYGLRLLRSTVQYSATPTFVVAMGLLVIGLVAIVSTLGRLGP